MIGFAETGMARAVLPLASRALFAFDMQHAPLWERETGALVARSGHKGVWSRDSATLASLTATGGTWTAPASVPGYEHKTLLGASRMVLTMDTSDRVVFPLGWGPQMFSGWLRFVETGARTVANSTLVSLAGNDPTTGVRFYLDTSGIYYRLTYHNGTASVTATLTSGAPTAGQVVDLRWQWAANGALSLWQSINGGAETTATSSALALPAAWASGAALRLNRRGLTANPGKMSFRSLVLAPGALTAAQLQGIW